MAAAVTRAAMANPGTDFTSSAARSFSGVMRAAARTEADRRPDGIPPFQAFLDEHRTVLYRFLVAAVGPNDADDCFQETFIAALRAYPKLENGDNLRAWVLAIATRKVIDAARARNRRPEPTADITEMLEASMPVRPEERNPASSEIEEPLWGEILALPPRQRVALVHRILLDRPYAELAAAMGCSLDAARANVYQALKKLREAWTSRG